MDERAGTAVRVGGERKERVECSSFASTVGSATAGGIVGALREVR